MFRSLTKPQWAHAALRKPVLALRGPARWALALGAPGVCLSLALLASPPAHAVPSFTDQTGMPCTSCHVGGFGPQLTPFGREFKLSGYTLRAKKSVPLAAMVQGSFTHTAADQNPPPAGFAPNDNVALDQVSLFVAGGAGKHVGGFAQITYDGVARQWHWDNLDVRLVNTGKVFGADTIYGLSINNAPTVQDAWNSTPAWGFPFSTSALPTTPGALPLIDGHLAQNVLGATAYGWFNHRIYVEAGAYGTPAAGTLSWLGIDPASPGDLVGLAPYGRVAWQGALLGGTAEAGAFVLRASLNPGRDHTTGLADHYADYGLDGSWQKPLKHNSVVSVDLRYTHEQSNLAASCALGLIGTATSPDCAHTVLNEWRGTATYSWHNLVGATLGGFATAGSSNSALYAPTGIPDSNGVTVQLDYTPWGERPSPLGPLVNLRMGVQYTAYGRFNGAVRNYDGNGANSFDNNTLRVFTWAAF